MEEKKSRSRKFLDGLNPFDYPERMLAFFILSFLLLVGALFLAERVGWMDSDVYILPIICFYVPVLALFGLVPLLLTLLNLSTLFCYQAVGTDQKGGAKN